MHSVKLLHICTFFADTVPNAVAKVLSMPLSSRAIDEYSKYTED